MRNKFPLIIGLQLLAGSLLHGQEIPFFSLFTQAPWGVPAWETGRSIPKQDPDLLQAITVPFSYPMETALLYSYKDIPRQTQTMATGYFPDTPIYWNRNTSMGSLSGIAFLYRKKNFGLNLDFALQMAGSEWGANLLESQISKIRMSVRIPNSWIGLKKSDYKLDAFLELAEMQRYAYSYSSFWTRPMQNAIYKTAENSARASIHTKQIYANPGLSLSSSSNFIFEGQVRVPMNSRESNRTLDELWTPEIQTHLGMKYIFE